MSEQHERTIDLLRRSIEGFDGIIPKDKVPIPESRSHDYLYVVGLLTGTVRFTETFLAP